MITIEQLCADSHRIAKEHGFWDNWDTAEEDLHPTLIDSKLMLIVGEVAEAEDALRRGKGDVAFAEELADIMIRTADLAGKLGINLNDAIYAKQKFNETRPYKHGKRF